MVEFFYQLFPCGKDDYYFFYNDFFNLQLGTMNKKYNLSIVYEEQWLVFHQEPCDRIHIRAAKNLLEGLKTPW